MNSRSRRTGLMMLILALCGLHAWMAASVSRVFSTTADEIVHLTSGYAYWTEQDYRFQPENGNFPQRWAALPLLAQNLRFPEKLGSDWQTADTWRLGHDFFYKQGNDLPAMLAMGRAMVAILSALLCLLIFCWARDLFGLHAGLIALLLAVFSPNLLAHGGLITSDTAAALGFTVAVLAWWRLLHRPNFGRLIIAGCCVGLLALSKYSVVLFAPISVLLIAIRLTRPRPLRMTAGRHTTVFTRWRRITAALGLLVATAVICAAVIWAAYGFRYQAAPTPSAATIDQLDFNRPWNAVLLQVPPLSSPLILADGSSANPGDIDHTPGPLQHIISWTRDHRLLPEAWLYGLAFVEINARGRLAYFAGEYSMTGWRAFFPTAFAVKTTLPTLGLIALGVTALAVSGRRRRVWIYRTAPLLVLLGVYWAFSIQSHLNIGHRHLLPIYPACFILAAGCTLFIPKPKIWGVIILLLLAWHGREALATRPDYLAYFNQIAGGPEKAHRLFVDSSLDWGQDLPRLHQWLNHNAKGEKIFLSYFGSGSPRHEGIDTAIRVGDGYFDWYTRPTPPPLTGGVYCISATMFRRVYTHVRGPWSISYENTYQRMLKWLRHINSRPPGTPITDLDGSILTQDVINDKLMIGEHLMFGRLCHFLQLREPDARAGYSFLIYRLTDEDVAFALTAPLPILNARLLELQAQPGPTRPRQAH